MARRDKRLGTVVMGYLIEQYIGWGSSSKVYRARHCKTGELAALKIVSKARARLAYVSELSVTAHSSTCRSVQRTIAECQVLSRLKHPNIVKLYSWAESERHVYIAMELARDGAMSHLLAQISADAALCAHKVETAYFLHFHRSGSC